MASVNTSTCNAPDAQTQSMRDRVGAAKTVAKTMVKTINAMDSYTRPTTQIPNDPVEIARDFAKDISGQEKPAIPQVAVPQVISFLAKNKFVDSQAPKHKVDIPCDVAPDVLHPDHTMSRRPSEQVTGRGASPLGGDRVTTPVPAIVLNNANETQDMINTKSAFQSPILQPYAGAGESSGSSIDELPEELAFGSLNLGAESHYLAADFLEEVGDERGQLSIASTANTAIRPEIFRSASSMLKGKSKEVAEEMHDRGFIERAAPIAYDLGTESPRSVLTSYVDDHYADIDDWARYGIAVHTSVPARPRNWRSSSFQGGKRLGTVISPPPIDYDCGICFDPAIKPVKTDCCQQIFCEEHLSDWLTGPSSDGRCPSCQDTCYPYGRRTESQPSPASQSVSIRDLSSDSETTSDADSGTEVSSPSVSMCEHGADAEYGALVEPDASSLADAVGTLDRPVAQVCALAGLAFALAVTYS